MLKGKAGRLVLGHSGLGGLRACCWAVRLVARHRERPPPPPALNAFRPAAHS